MTQSSRRTATIIAIVVLTPLICYGLGLLHGVIYPNPDIVLNEIGDPAGLTLIVCIAMGVLGSVIALAAGPAVSFYARQVRQRQDSLVGYIIPCGLAVVLSLVLCFGGN